MQAIERSPIKNLKPRHAELFRGHQRIDLLPEWVHSFASSTSSAPSGSALRSDTPTQFHANSCQRISEGNQDGDGSAQGCAIHDESWLAFGVLFVRQQMEDESWPHNGERHIYFQTGWD
jgi:hypothetical protein